MILRQTAYSNSGNMDYDWEVFGTHKDSRGEFVRIGCWLANYWFCVAKGKTDKLTLSYAKRRLQSRTLKKSIFRYID